LHAPLVELIDGRGGAPAVVESGGAPDPDALDTPVRPLWVNCWRHDASSSWSASCHQPTMEAWNSVGMSVLATLKSQGAVAFSPDYPVFSLSPEGTIPAETAKLGEVPIVL